MTHMQIHMHLSPIRSVVLALRGNKHPSIQTFAFMILLLYNLKYCLYIYAVVGRI